MEGKDEEEHNQELEQQEKEAEIREVSRNRKAPKEEEVQILTDAPGDRAIVMSVMRCVTVEEAKSRIRSELRCWSGDGCTMPERKVSRASVRSKEGEAIDERAVHVMERLQGGGEHERKRQTNLESETNEWAGRSERDDARTITGRDEASNYRLKSETLTDEEAHSCSQSVERRWRGRSMEGEPGRVMARVRQKAMMQGCGRACAGSSTSTPTVPSPKRLLASHSLWVVWVFDVR